MLTENEKAFIAYWEQNRGKKKRLIWQLAAGFPLAMLIAGGILVNVYSDWFKGSASIFRAEGGLFLILLIAVILIVIFIIVFSARHRWEMNEQHYKELLARRDK